VDIPNQKIKLYFQTLLLNDRTKSLCRAYVGNLQTNIATGVWTKQCPLTINGRIINAIDSKINFSDLASIK